MSDVRGDTAIMNPFIPSDVSRIRSGDCTFRGSLLFADISGFTRLTGMLALQGKKGTEELSEILNSFFSIMYGIVRKGGGCVISSAGDSMLVRFPPGSDPGICAERMMDSMVRFRDLETVAGRFTLDIKIVLGHGSWAESIVGNDERAHIFLSGELVGMMASAEESAGSGEIVSISSDREVRLPRHIMNDVPDRAFFISGTENVPGEHRSIAALFLNVTGFDAADPPMESIRTLYDSVSVITRRHMGVVQMVDNFLAGGFRVFLLFGAPRSYGRDVTQCLQAGMELAGALRGHRGLRISAGMDEGYAFAGVIGSSWRRDYTVIGDVVNTAARIADRAGHGELEVTEGVRRTVGNQFVFDATGEFSAGGMKEAVSLHTPVSRMTDPVYSYRFVGREDETRRLLEDVLTGGCIRLIEGEAGIGKTRLLDRLSLLLSRRGVKVLSGSCPEHSQTDGILTSLVGNMAGMLEDDSQAVRKSRLSYLIQELEDSSGIISKKEPFLGRMLFSIDYPDSDYQSLPPRLRRENMIDGICELLTAGEDMTCVVLEDVHNCTDQDLRAIEYICGKVLDRSGRTSFLISRRPDERDIPGSKEQGPVLMRLDSLDETAQEALMLEILGGLPLESNLEDIIRRRSEGNPFYLMQFLLYLMEEKLVQRQEDRWVPTGNYADDRLPGNVFSMIMARIDRLERQAKESLRIGSVMGIRFDGEVVGRVAGKNVHSSLAQCSEAGLTYRSDLRDLEFVFSHTLIKDVTYDSILRKRRKGIHGEIARIVEEMHGDDPESVCPILAYHFKTAEIWHSAVMYGMMAAEKADSEYRNQNAIGYYDDVIGILEDRGDSIRGMDEDPDGLLARCCREAGRIYDRLGEYEKALEYYERALQHSSDPGMTGELSLLKADIIYTRGRVEESLEMLDGIESGLEAAGEFPLHMIRIECFRAWAFCVTGKIEKAMEKALKAVRLSNDLQGVAERERAHRIGFAYNTLATVYWAGGDYASAGEYYQKALEIAEAGGMKREMAVTWGNIGLVSQKMGNMAGAVDSFSMQKDLAGEIGEKLVLMTSSGSLASAYSSLGMLEEARDTATVYGRQAEELPAMQDILIARNLGAILDLAVGKRTEASRECLEVLNMEEAASFERERASAMLILGLTRMEEGNDEEADELFRAAEGMARSLQSRSLLLNVLTAIAYHMSANARYHGIRDIMEEVTTLVNEMGMITGEGRMRMIGARTAMTLGRSKEALSEALAAEELYRRMGLRPARADALALICSVEDGGGSRKNAETLAKIRNETGIVPVRSAVLQIL